MTPEVSIIIPTYNQRPEWLNAAVESARVQGDCKSVEVIVVDDGSIPQVELGEEWFGRGSVGDVTLCYQVDNHGNYANAGISAALNRGIEDARGEWICWLPSDDLYLANKVEVQLADLKASGLKAGFHGWYAFKDDPTKPHGQSVGWNWSSHKRQLQQMASGCAINGLTVMIHRSVFEDVGLFDTSFRYGQDWEMWCRITRKYEWRCTPHFLALRRDSGQNLTARIAQDDAMRAVRDAEDKRIREMYPWPSRGAEQS